MVNAGLKVVKFLMFVFNFLFVVCGIALIAIGSWVLASSSKYSKLFGEESYLAAPIILIVAGVIIFFIAFMGCCGAIKENRCMLITFGTFLILISILEIAAGITGYVFRNSIDETVLRETRNNLNQYSQGDKSVDDFVDVLQHDLKCCGAANYTDWKTTKWGQAHPNAVPDSCCIAAEKGCGAKSTTGIYTSGCYSKFKEFFESRILIVAGIGIGIGLVELLGIIFAFCLASAIKRKHEIV
jgi:CD63 antigen